MHHHGIEAAFAVITFIVVIIGWYLADMMYRQHTLDPARFSEMFGGVPYEWVYNKYYVDEFYDRAVVQPYLYATRAFAWFDSNIIDGVVNLAARIIVFGSWLSGLFDKLCRRRVGEFRVECDVRGGRQAAAAADRLDQWIPVRNSGGGDVDPAGAGGRTVMTESAAAPIQGKREERKQK